MQIVIDINADYYEMIKHDVEINHSDYLPVKLIAKGTPFPEAKWEEKSVINIEDEPNAITEWQSARCSNCNLYHTTPYSYYFDNYNYCPNCGARMTESEDKE